MYIDVASPPSLAPHLDIFVIQHLFKIRFRVICLSRHIISRSPVICRLWYHVPGPRFIKSCSGWVAMKLTLYTGAGTLMSFFVSLLSFPSLYQTAAYVMGKHVPGGNLFPTV